MLHGASRSSRVAALAALAALSVAQTAGAQGLVARLPGLGPTSFSFTNTSIVRYRGINFDRNVHDDDFFSLTERLDIAAQAAPWRLYVRVDGYSPWNHDTTCTGAAATQCYLHSNWQPGERPFEGGRDPATGDAANPPTARRDITLGGLLPERLNLRFRRGDVTVEGGDYYQVFGRGLALAFRKVDPIGLDTTLRGGRFEYERERLTLRAFGGLANPQNLDPISLSIFPDPDDLLAGASLAARAGRDGDLELSAHAVHADFERDSSTNRHDVVDIAGGRFEFPSLLDGALTLYGEANVLRRESRTQIRTDADGNERFGSQRFSWGRGVYAAAQLITGRWTILAEWKDYTNYLLAPSQLGGSAPRDVARIYSTAPSLERDDQRIFTNANTRGARVRLDYAFEGSPWILTLNSVLYGWSDHFDESGTLVDPWDSTDGYLTTHTYFAVRRRSRPVTQPGEPGAAGGGGAASGAPAGGATVAASGMGGGAVTRVGRGDFNLLATAGYRREFHAGTAPTTGGAEPEFQAGDIKHESLQFDLDVAFPVGSNDSLELRVDNRFERNFVFDRITGFDAAELVTGMRGGVALSWSHGLPLVVSASLRWDNTSRPPGERLLFGDSVGGVSAWGRAPEPTNASVDPRLPTLYPSAEVRWNFTLNNFVRVFGGMTPGGRVCSGGVCRDVPLFQGAVAELVLRI